MTAIYHSSLTHYTLHIHAHTHSRSQSHPQHIPSFVLSLSKAIPDMEPIAAQLYDSWAKPLKLGRMEVKGTCDLWPSLTLIRGLRLPTDTLAQCGCRKSRLQLLWARRDTDRVGRAGCPPPHTLPLHLL